MLSSKDVRKQLLLLRDSSAKLAESLSSVACGCRASLSSQILSPAEKSAIAAALFDAHDGVLPKAALLRDDAATARGARDCRGECVKLLTAALQHLAAPDDAPHCRFVLFGLEHLDSEDNYVREAILDAFSAVLIKAPGCFRSRDDIGNAVFERCNLLYCMQSFKSTPAIRGLCLRVLSQTILRFSSTRTRAPQLHSHIKGLFDEIQARGIDAKHKPRFIGALDALAFCAPLLDVSENFRLETLSILVKQLDAECTNHDSTRYDFMKSILNVVCRQSEWFGCILLQREASILLDKYLTGLCSHKNTEVRSCAFRAQESFISQFSLQLSHSQLPDHDLLKLLEQRYVSILTSRASIKHVCLGLRSLGHLSNSLRVIDPNEVKGIAQLFLDNGSLYLNINLSGNDDTITTIPSLLNGFSQVLANMHSVDPSSRAFITKCSTMIFRVFPSVYPKMRPVFMKSLHHTLMILARHSDGLKDLIDDIVFQGLLMFISPFSNEATLNLIAENIESTQAELLTSLVSPFKLPIDKDDELPSDVDVNIEDSELEDEAYKDFIRDAVMRQFLRIFEELSIGYRPVAIKDLDESEKISESDDLDSDDDKALFGQENLLISQSGVAPTCHEDMVKFVRLSDVLGLMFSSFPNSCLQKWMPSWIEVVCSKIASYPLVTSLYTLLKHIFSSCRPDVLCTLCECKHVVQSLQLAAAEIFERSIQFRDHLFKTTLICLLNAPAIALTRDAATKILSKGLTIGLSDSAIALNSMNSLTNWWEAMPDWTSAFSPLLAQVQFYISPSVSKKFNPEDINASRFKVKEPKKYQSKVQEKTAGDELDIQVVQLAISIIGKFGPCATQSLMHRQSDDLFQNLHMADWSLCEVEIPTCESNSDPVLFNLDLVAPRAAFLALNGATRQIRANGAELFHAICSVLVATIKANTLDRHAKMLPRYLKICVKLASDEETICQKLFRPLVRQVVNFCIISHYQQILIPRILDVLFEVAISAEDAAQRQTSADVIAEFIGNAAKIYDSSCSDVSMLELGLRRVKAMLESSSSTQRLSACEIINNKLFYIPFREHPQQLSASVFSLYMVEGCLKCIKLACKDDPVLDSFTSAKLALHRFERLMSKASLLAELQHPHPRRLGPPGITLSKFLSGYSFDICSPEKRYRDKIIRFLQKYGAASLQVRNSFFNHEIVSTCFDKLEKSLIKFPLVGELGSFHSFCGFICAFYDAYQHFHAFDAKITLQCIGPLIDAVTAALTFLTYQSRALITESVAGKSESPRFIRSSQVQLSFVIYCTSKFLASQSIARDNQGFLLASLRICLVSLLRPDSLGLTISGGRTLKIDTPKQILLAAGVSPIVDHALKSEMLVLLKESPFFQAEVCISKSLSDLLLGMLLLDPLSSIIEQAIEPFQVQRVLHQISSLEYSCSPRAVSWSTSIVAGLCNSSKFAKHIVDCICNFPRELDIGTIPPGALFFKRFSGRLAKFVVKHSNLLYSTLAHVLSSSDLKQAACVLELTIDTLNAAKSVIFSDSVPNFIFVQDVLRPFHEKMKVFCVSDSMMQSLCARFVHRVFNLHPNLREEISLELSSWLFDILLSIIRSTKPDKVVLNDIISRIFPFFLSPDSPLNVKVKTFITDCFLKIGSLKVLQELPPDDLRKLEAHTTIMNIFDCISNSHWHGIIESIYGIYMENVALIEKLNLALTHMLTNLTTEELTCVNSKFIRLVSSRETKSSTQQFLRLQLCKNLWPLILSACSDKPCSVEIHSCAWEFIGSILQSINNYKGTELTSLDVAVDWLCSFCMLEIAYRQLPKEKLFFKPVDVEQKKFSQEIMKALSKARRDIVVNPNVQLRFLHSLSRHVLLSSHNAFIAYICCTQSLEDIFSKNIFRCNSQLWKNLLCDLDLKFKVEIKFEIHKSTLNFLQNKTNSIQQRPDALKIHFSDASSMALDASVISSQSVATQETLSDSIIPSFNHTRHGDSLDIEMDSFAQIGVLIPMLHALDVASRVFDALYSNLASSDADFSKSWIADWIRVMYNDCEDPRIRLLFAKVVILRPKFFEVFKYKQYFCAALCSCCELATRHFHPEECSRPSFNYFVRDLCALLGDWYSSPVPLEAGETPSNLPSPEHIVVCESLQGLINTLIPTCIIPKASIWKSNIGFIEIFARICCGLWRVDFDSIIQPIATLCQGNSQKRHNEVFSIFDASVLTFIHAIDLSLQYANPQSTCSQQVVSQFISIFDKFLSPENAFNLSRKLLEGLFELASLIQRKIPILDSNDVRLSIFATAPQLFEISRRVLLHLSNSGRDDDHFICYLKKSASFCPDMLVCFRAQASALVTKVHGDLRYCILEAFRDYFSSSNTKHEERMELLREIIPFFSYLLNSLDSQAQLLVFEICYSVFHGQTTSSSSIESFNSQLQSRLLSVLFENSCHVLSKKPRLKMLLVLSLMHSFESLSATERENIESIFRLDIASPHQQVRAAARDFWAHLCHSQSLNGRLEVCVNRMFHPTNCSAWIHTTVALLMQCLQDDSNICITNNLKIKSQEKELMNFPSLSSNPADAALDSKLTAFSFGADRSSFKFANINKSSNLYTMTQEDGPILTQLNASQQGMEDLDGSSMNTMDIFATNDAFISVVKKSKTQQARPQKFPLRFQGSDPDEARKVAIRLARNRSDAFIQNIEIAKRISSEPEMLRRYRQDDNPDQEISLADVMKPLAASCLCDESIASVIFGILMKHQTHRSALGARKIRYQESLFSLLLEPNCILSIEKMLETATAREACLVGSLINCFLENQKFCLAVESVVESSIRCGVVRIGVAYLEGAILQVGIPSCHSIGFDNKSGRNREDSIKDKWDGLLQLYESISDEDSLLAAYDMSESNPYAKQAFSDEAGGFFELALQFYQSNSDDLQPHLHRGFFNCLQSLGMWDEAALEFERNLTSSASRFDHLQATLSNLVRADSAKLTIRSCIKLDKTSRFAHTLESRDSNNWSILRDDAAVAMLNFDSKETSHTKFRIREALISSPQYVHQLANCEVPKGNQVLSQLFRLIQISECIDFLTSSKSCDQSIISLENKWLNRLRNASCDFGFFSDIIASSRYLLLKLRVLRPGLGEQFIQSLSEFLTEMSTHVINLGYCRYGLSLIREALSIVKEQGSHPSAHMLVSYAHAVTRVEFMQRNSADTNTSSSALATVSQIKACLSEFSRPQSGNYDISLKLISFRHLESLVTAGIANEDEKSHLIVSSFQDLISSLHDVRNSSLLSQSDLLCTHRALISWLSTQLSSSCCDVDTGGCTVLRDSFISQVVKSISEIIRYSGDSGASYIPLAIQLSIESCVANLTSPLCQVFRESVPLFQNFCCKWLSQILAEYQAALLKNCKPVYDPLELMLSAISAINPQAMFFAISCTIDSALVFLPASQFKMVNDRLTSILKCIPNALFYQRFVSELQSFVDPDQLWSSVAKISQEMINSNLQEQSFQYLNKHLSRWNTVSYWKSQAFCRKYDLNLQKIDYPVDASNFSSAQTILRSFKDSFQGPKLNTQGFANISCFSSFLAEYDGFRSSQRIIEFSTMCYPLDAQVEIFRFKSDVWIAKSKTKPKKITLVASDGLEYSYLCKGTEDLRQDQRVSQLFSISQKIMDSNAQCRSKQLKLNFYSVYPMTIDFGIVEWMPNAASLGSIVKSGFRMGSGDPSKILENCVTMYMSTVLDNKVQNGEILAASVNKSLSGEMPRRMEKIASIIPQDALRRGMHLSASSIMAFHQFRHEFSRTVSASSAVQWILGIGDRHAENNLLSKKDGGLLPIDFGIAFGDGVSRLPIPELMPFRLSPQMQFVFAPLRAKFILRRRIASVLSALREKSSEVLSLCEVFVKDRLLNVASLGNSRESFHDEGALLENIRHDISALKLSLTERPSLQKYMAIKAKLQCMHPGDQIVELLESNPHLQKHSTIKTKLIELLREYCRQNDKPLSPLECSDLILDMAQDFRLTGIAFRGWQAWL